QVDVLIDRLLATRPEVGAATAAMRVAPESIEDFEAAFIATELAMRSWTASLNDRSYESVRLMSLALQANSRDRCVSYDIADRMYATLDQAFDSGLGRRAALTRIVSIRPDHVAAIKDLWQLEREQGNDERAAYYRTLLEGLSP